MRTGQHTQSSVALISVVQMESNSEHSLEKFSRWLDVRNAVFCAPRAKSGHLGKSSKRQRQILVPRNQPIYFGRLVEVDSPNWKRLGLEMRANEIQKQRRTCQLDNSRHVEKTASAGSGNWAKRT